ncbi:MAG: hypothetical protein MI892_10275, partial [Desulfobacterales bacterium]|nr:hypothetical protein [Desulfobacterales bacterium]
MKGLFLLQLKMCERNLTLSFICGALWGDGGKFLKFASSRAYELCGMCKFQRHGFYNDIEMNNMT